MMEDECPVCGAAMEQDGFDHTGYWRVWSCTACPVSVQEATAGEADGMSPADLQNLSDYTDS